MFVMKQVYKENKSMMTGEREVYMRTMCVRSTKSLVKIWVIPDDRKKGSKFTIKNVTTFFNSATRMETNPGNELFKLWFDYVVANTKYKWVWGYLTDYLTIKTKNEAGKFEEF